MKAEIKYIFSPDVEDLENFHPSIEDEFCLLLQLVVGPFKEKGEESFDIVLCTPKWLLSNKKENDIIYGRHYLIVFKYDYQSIYSSLHKYVDSVTGDTWDAVAEKIGRIGKWEFEDYRPK
ncbi:MAG: immunity 8 family protein [Bacteroidia bacterium]|jgi:hypothetical protein